MRALAIVAALPRPRQQELPGHDVAGHGQRRERVLQRDLGLGHAPRIYNTFYNGTAAAGWPARGRKPRSPPPTSAGTRIGTDTLVRGSGLQDTYRSTSGVTSWTRDVVYLRPSLFVTYDRTVVTSTTGDQHMNWHFVPTLCLRDRALIRSAAIRRHQRLRRVRGDHDHAPAHERRRLHGQRPQLQPGCTGWKCGPRRRHDVAMAHRAPTPPPPQARSRSPSRLTAADGSASANVTVRCCGEPRTMPPQFGYRAGLHRDHQRHRDHRARRRDLVVVDRPRASAGLFRDRERAAGGNLTRDCPARLRLHQSASGAFVRQRQLIREPSPLAI